MNNNSINVNAGVSQSPINKGYDALSANAKNKYDALVNLYGVNTLELVNLLDARGANSFQTVYDKAEKLKTETDHTHINYTRLISESFEVDEPVTVEEIVFRIAECRRKLKMSAILTKVKPSCLAELANIFIVKPDYHEDDLELHKNKRRITAYIPVFDLTQLIEH